jgi:hypothetical protein
LLGVLIYRKPASFDPTISNHIPDGLWSFSLTIAILKIWDWKLNLINSTLLVTTSIIVEWLQLIGFIDGTADTLDVVFYLLFALFAITYLVGLKKLGLLNF